MTTGLFVGMSGPREAIQFTFTDPSVDWTQSKVLSLTLTYFPDPSRATPAPVVLASGWSWAVVGSTATATYVPSGTEIVAPGWATGQTVLTVGGSVIGTRGWQEKIAAR
jgi:hypothetical protein